MNVERTDCDLARYFLIPGMAPGHFGQLALLRQRASATGTMRNVSDESTLTSLRPRACSQYARSLGSKVACMIDAHFDSRIARHVASGDGLKLLAAAPIIAVAQELDRHVLDLRRLAPTSDATAALLLYRDKLAAAIQRGRQIELFVSAEAAAVILGKSASMVTYLCRTNALKAKKVGGTWQIDRLDLERLRNGHEGPADG